MKFRSISIFIIIIVALLLGCKSKNKQEDNNTQKKPSIKNLKQFSVSIIGVIAPYPVKFNGFCIATIDGRELRKELKDMGMGNINKTFRAEELIRCEVTQTSQTGWIQLIVSVDGKTIYESEKTNGPGTILYEK